MLSQMIEATKKLQKNMKRIARLALKFHLRFGILNQFEIIKDATRIDVCMHMATELIQIILRQTVGKGYYLPVGPHIL